MDDSSHLLYMACLHGDNDTVFMLAELVDDFEEGLRGACRGGHIELVKLMIERGAKEIDVCLCEAALGGYQDIVTLLFEYGAIETETCHGFAYMSGNNALIQMLETRMIEHNIPISYDLAIMLSCVGKRTEAAYTLAKKHDMFNALFCGYAYNGDINALQTLNNITEDGYISAIRIASFTGNVDVAKYILNITTLTEENMIDCLYDACKDGNVKIVDVLLETNIYCDLDDILANLSPKRDKLIILDACEAPESRRDICSRITSKIKDVAISLILRGADINLWQGTLTPDDVYYLCKTGVKEMGKYKNIATTIKIASKLTTTTLHDILLPEIVNLIIEY